MGPKKKGGKGGKGGKGSGGIIDGVPMSEMTKEQLEKFTLRIQEELEREREERNFFQLERDKIRTFWEITRQQQEENKSEIRNKERALEEADERHEAEIKVFNEKIKHLIHEHECRLTEVKAENMVALKIAQEDYNGQEAKLIEEKEKLKKEMVEAELSHEEELRIIQKNHSEELFGLRTEFMKKLEEMAVRAEKRLQVIRNYYETKNKVEIAQIVESKNDVVHRLETNHTRDLSEMRNYFKGITDNNLPLIADLKNELSQSKEEKVKMKNIIEKLQRENGTLSVPLEEAKEKVKILERQVKDMKNSKSALFAIHKRYAALQTKFEDVMAEKDGLEVKLEKLESENEGIKTNYATMVVNIKETYSLEISKLEKNILFLEKELERKEIQVGQLIQKTSLDPKTLMYATNKLQQAMVKREKKMEKLQIELCKVVKAHDELLTHAQNLASIYRIPKDELPQTPYQPVLRKLIAELMSEGIFDYGFREILDQKNEDDYED